MKKSIKLIDNIILKINLWLKRFLTTFVLLSLKRSLFLPCCTALGVYRGDELKFGVFLCGNYSNVKSIKV